MFVPRPHTEALALRAAELLPDGGLAVDLCTGSGAIGAVLLARRPRARVVGTDISRDALATATENAATLGLSSRAQFVESDFGAMLEGEFDPSFVVTHRLPIDQGPAAYRTFRDKKDNCIKVVLKPW